MGLGDVSNMVTLNLCLFLQRRKAGQLMCVIYAAFLPSRAGDNRCYCYFQYCALEGTVTRQIVPSVGYGNTILNTPVVRSTFI